MNLNDLLKYINEFIGIYYPSERADELERLISLAARESNFNKTDEFVDFLFSVPQQDRIRLLAKYLTIGETYFFREIATFEALKPALVNLVSKNASLDIWSAGCCTGEEPYSIAIMITELFPQKYFRLNITATDINHDFLSRALIGEFSNWSFRGVSEAVRKKYFTPAGNNKYRISDDIKKMVNFSFLNLAEGSYHFPHHTGKFDLIFCRNVIMYFSEELRNRVVDNFYNMLNQDGFLALGLAEISNYYTRRFARVNFENTVLFQKKHIPEKIVLHKEPEKTPDSGSEHPARAAGVTEKVRGNSAAEKETNSQKKPVKTASLQTPTEAVVPDEEARYLFESGEYEKAINILLTDLSNPPAAGHNRDKRIESFEVLIKALTSAGNIELAIDWCRKGIEENKLSARFYILMANLLNISGDTGGAIEELKKAVYLEPGSFLGNFYIANIYRKNNNLELARRHLHSALSILSGFDQDEVLEETEGITAGRMKEIVERQLKIINNK